MSCSPTIDEDPPSPSTTSRPIVSDDLDRVRILVQSTAGDGAAVTRDGPHRDD
jgi:hypothetical protein